MGEFPSYERVYFNEHNTDEEPTLVDSDGVIAVNYEIPDLESEEA